MKLFIHACVTLEYFNLNRENDFERLVVYFYCFSDNCCRVTAGGNKIAPHLNHHRSFVKGLARSLSAFLFQVLVNTTSKTLVT